MLQPLCQFAESHWLVGSVLAYFLVEAWFAVYFYKVLIPRANQPNKRQPVYRDYAEPSDRLGLLLKIINRIKSRAQRQNRPVRYVFEEYILQCFDKVPSKSDSKDTISRIPSFGSTASTSSSTISDLDTDEYRVVTNQTASVEPEGWIIPGLRKDEMDEFLSWAFFNKNHHHLYKNERAALSQLYDMLKKELGLGFSTSGPSLYKPRRMSLEPMNAMHRPLAVYIGADIMRFVTRRVIMPLLGFKRIRHGPTGQTGWHRAAKNKQMEKLQSLVFFHGISPGGVSLYLPTVLKGLAHDGREIFMFDLPPITVQLGAFDFLAEHDFVVAVEDMVKKYITSHKQHMALVGHSFGSVPITWLLRGSKYFQKKCQQVVLLDPITVLLSDPAVLNNFIYPQGSMWTTIRLAASSELFIQHYMRRHFNWYNSELWLPDNLPPHVQLVVGLSELDEIVPSVAVHEEIMANYEHDPSRLQMLFWKGSGHGHCAYERRLWREIYTGMLRNELKAATVAAE